MRPAARRGRTRPRAGRRRSSTRRPRTSSTAATTSRRSSYYEKLEARYPYGRYAQQAQLEIAYAYYKDNEPAQAVTAADRFIKLHPNHPNVDYAYYLKGLANFNDDLGWAGYVSGQDLTERDPKAAREAFEAFKEPGHALSGQPLRAGFASRA